MLERKQWKDHVGPVLDEVDGFDVIECERCGFKHIIPIPSPEELADVYREQYYLNEKPLYFKRYQEDLDWWNLTYEFRYRKFETLLGTDRRKILDVGSGPGIFLQHGIQRGWKGVGIEPSRLAAQHSRDLGLEIIEEFLSEDNVGSLGLYDIVHMSQVLEHVPDPAAMVNLSWQLVLPGGLYCIVVPNDYNPFQKALTDACGFKPWWVSPPHHINYFSYDSLGRLLTRNGFDIVSGTTTFPIDMFLLMGDNYVGSDETGRECHRRRMDFERNLIRAGKSELLEEIYTAFSKLGLGRELLVIARKK